MTINIYRSLLSGFLALTCLVANAESSVGVIAPLTGALAGYGTAIKNGIELAKKEHPELFKSCEIQIEDSAYDPARAITAFRKLNQIDRVSLIYNFGGPTSAAIAPLAERAKLPSLLWATDPTLSIGFQYAIRFTNRSEEFTSVLTKQLALRGIKRLGIVVTENQYLNNMLDGVRGTLGQGQTLSVIDTVEPGINDFRSTVSKIKHGYYDAVGVFLLSGQVGQFYRQLQEQNVTVATFGTDFFEDSNEIRTARGAMEGAVYANNSVDTAFAERYRAQFDNDVQLTYAGSGYDFAMLACSTVNINHSAQEIIHELESETIREGILGQYNFVQNEDGDRYFKYPVVLKQVAGTTYGTLAQ